jgi:hypothetical protein
MRKLLGLMLCFGLCTMLGLGSVGCSKKKEEAKKAAKKDGGGNGGDKTKITLSADDVTVEAGKKGSVKVTASKKATEDMALTFSAVKNVEFGKATIKKGEDSAMADVTVAEKAKAGDNEVTVTGGNAEAKFKLTIKEKAAAPKKASIKLSVDPVTIELKDKKGKGTAKIAATRDNYDGAIEVKFGKTPTGVTIKDATIAKGKDSVEVEVTADGASAGDAEVTVSGTGGDAAADTKLKLTLKAAK